MCIIIKLANAFIKSRPFKIFSHFHLIWYHTQNLHQKEMYVMLIIVSIPLNAQRVDSKIHVESEIVHVIFQDHQLGKGEDHVSVCLIFYNMTPCLIHRRY